MNLITWNKQPLTFQTIYWWPTRRGGIMGCANNLEKVWELNHTWALPALRSNVDGGHTGDLHHWFGGNIHGSRAPPKNLPCQVRKNGCPGLPTFGNFWAHYLYYPCTHMGWATPYQASCGPFPHSHGQFIGQVAKPTRKYLNCLSKKKKEKKWST